MSKNTNTTRPDVRQLGEEKLPDAEFPGNGLQEFRIYMDPSVDVATREHAAQDTTIEICGVLVGRWKRDTHGPFVAITASIRGDAAASKLAEVTFTHETWAKINAKMDSEFRNDAIVGWYHTHPDFGIFLSDRDRFIHDHFFSGPGQVAYVIDPIRKTRGFFTWKEGKSIPAAAYWIGKEMHLDESGSETKRDSHDRHERTDPSAQTPSKQQGLPEVTDISWTSLVMIGLVMALVFTFGTYFTSQKSAYEQMILEEGTVAHYGINQFLRPSLVVELDQLSNKLAELADDADKANQPSPAATTQAAADRAVAAADLKSGLDLCRQDLEILKRRYVLSPAEADMVRKLLADQTSQVTDSNLSNPNAPVSPGVTSAESHANAIGAGQQTPVFKYEGPIRSDDSKPAKSNDH